MDAWQTVFYMDMSLVLSLPGKFCANGNQVVRRFYVSFHFIPVNPILTPIDSQIGLSCLTKAFDLRSCDGGFPIFREIHMFLGIVFQPPVKSIHLYVIRTELIHFIEFVPRFS
jgi:hypothetical protein